MNKQVVIAYGVISNSLSKQLKNQGFKFNRGKINIFQREINAINQLRFGSCLLTGSMVDKLFQKLHNKIVAHLEEENKISPSLPPTKQTTI